MTPWWDLCHSALLMLMRHHETRCWLRWTMVDPHESWSHLKPLTIHTFPGSRMACVSCWAWGTEMPATWRCCQKAVSESHVYQHHQIGPEMSWFFWQHLLFSCRRIHCVGVDHFGALRLQSVPWVPSPTGAVLIGPQATRHVEPTQPNETGLWPAASWEPAGSWWPMMAHDAHDGPCWSCWASLKSWHDSSWWKAAPRSFIFWDYHSLLDLYGCVGFPHMIRAYLREVRLWRKLRVVLRRGWWRRSRGWRILAGYPPGLGKSTIEPRLLIEFNGYVRD